LYRRAVAHFDAIIVGGGHNGLTCAAYLTRAGVRVCVLERRHVLGGACVTEELWPGYRVSRRLLHKAGSVRRG
jgi:phytoene dehydrogenase-like protein